MNGLDLIEQVGRARRQQIGQAGSDAGVDHRGAPLFGEALVVGELLGLEWIARQVRSQIEIMRAQAQRRSQSHFVEYGRRGVHQQLAAARRAHDSRADCAH